MTINYNTRHPFVTITMRVGGGQWVVGLVGWWVCVGGWFVCVGFVCVV